MFAQPSLDFVFSPSVFLNSFPQNSSPPWYPTEAAGKDAEEGGHDDERKEEGRQEEEEEEEKKVDLSQPSASLLPDLLEFERCVQRGGMVYSLGDSVGKGTGSSQPVWWPPSMHDSDPGPKSPNYRRSMWEAPRESS